MGKELFPNVYDLLSVLISTDNRYLELKNRLDRMDMEMLKEEAQKVLELMDQYKEPELPFKDITAEEISKAFVDLDQRHRFVVWSNMLAGSDADCANRVKADPDYFLGMTEDEVREISQEAYTEDLELIKEEFKKLEIGYILITGTVGRWDGPKPVCSVKPDLNSIFQLFTGDISTLYIEDGQLKIENCHHDGTDRFEVFMFESGFNPKSLELTNYGKIRQKAVSIVPALNKHFGWV